MGDWDLLSSKNVLNSSYVCGPLCLQVHEKPATLPFKLLAKYWFGLNTDIVWCSCEAEQFWKAACGRSYVVGDFRETDPSSWVKLCCWCGDKNFREVLNHVVWSILPWWWAPVDKLWEPKDLTKGQQFKTTLLQLNVLNFQTFKNLILMGLSLFLLVLW